MTDTTEPRPLSLADLRRNYTRAGLDEEAADADPIVQCGRWLHEAVEAGVPEPNAMTLATATPDGLPAARTVLLKGLDERGFVFYTNYESQKGHELAANPRAALVLYWAELERQVRVVGAVSMTTREETEHYFRSRPVGSQLGAWVSRQSQPVADRGVLEVRLRELEASFGDGPIAPPPFWGGYRVAAETVEFWQGRPDRLHDRLRYTRQSDGRWQIERLAP